jgi:ElaA protein
MVRFETLPFEALRLHQLYALLRLRAEVFVVEQDCPYQDLDGLDLEARHLLGTRDGELVACARWYWCDGPDPQGDPEDGPAMVLGRIVTSGSVRGQGVGHRLMEAALAAIDGEGAGPLPVRMHAQAHLERFYNRFGFATRGEPFDEDGIPHLLMVREP